MVTKKFIKELQKEAKRIDCGEFLTQLEFESKHNIKILGDEELLAEDWLSPEDEKAVNYV